MIADVLCFQFFSKVAGNPHYVFHDGCGVFENVFVYLLMNVTNTGATLAVSCRVGFVDVADFECFGVQNLAVDLKFFGNLLKLLFLIGHSGI